MTDHPRTRALLTALCGLDAEDAQLPLTVIGNVYKGVLCEPLLGVGLLRERYLDLRRSLQARGSRPTDFRDVLLADHHLDWDPIINNEQLEDAMDMIDYRACTVVRARIGGVLRQVLDEPINSYQAYEALALLYYVGQGAVPMAQVAPAVELCLYLVPPLHAFALERAQAARTRPVQSE